MQGKENPNRNFRCGWNEFPFIPRIINPIRIRDVVLFSADEEIRRSGSIIQAEMPWAQVRVLSNPLTVSNVRSDGAMVLIVDDVALNLVDAKRIRQSNHDVVIVLLSFVKLIQYSPPFIARKEFPYVSKADLIFAVNRNEYAVDKIITSVVRSAEDRLNIDERSEVRRFIVLIVDDEPCWPSQFLPVLYRIIGQRADVKITRTYEETVEFLFGVRHESEIQENYRDFGSGDQVICLITDILFPKDENISSNAGRDLIRLVNKYYIRIPIIIASKAKEAFELADKGFVLPKGDPGSLEILKSYIRDHTGIGDFVIYAENGDELYRLKDVREIYRLLLKADGKSPEAARLRSLLETYGEKDKFSTWFYMHGLQALGDRLRPQKLKGKKMIAMLKRLLKSEMLRMHYTPLIVGGIKMFNLQELLQTLRSAPPEQIDQLSQDDIISSWLDQQGFSELAEELRPIHGKGPEPKEAIVGVVERWTKVYRERNRSFRGLPESL